MENIAKSINNSSVPDESASPRYQTLLVGCFLAIGGNLLISISLNIQKYTHNKLRNAETGNEVHYTKVPLWWLGLVLMGIGEVGNFSAYGFAPASVVAPLGTTTVIANAFIAVLLLKEKFRAKDVFGAALAVVGAFVLVSFSTKKEKIMTANEIVQALQELPFVIYMSIEVALLIGLFVARYKFGVDSVLVLLLICALFASMTVISAKAVSGMLQITFMGDMQLNTAIFWILLIVLLVTAITQVKYLNQAMKLYDATTVVPTHFVFFTISAIIAGVIFYKELWGMAALDIFLFLFGCCLCFVGVHFITSGRGQPEPKLLPADEIKCKYCPDWIMAYVNELRAKCFIPKSSKSNSEVAAPSSVSYPAGEGYGMEERLLPEIPANVEPGASNLQYGTIEKDGP